MYDPKPLNPFLNSERQLRSGWWILIFFLVLASILLPTLLVAQQNAADVSIGLQAVIIALASLICQLLRRKPMAELLGKLNFRWFKELYLGGLLGSALMLVPALTMRVFGWVDWHWKPTGFSAFIQVVLLFAGVAAAEELLFRGFVFQRLITALGQWPAQLILAGYFLLTHFNNPGMTGDVKVLAGINIFLASIMFGLAFIRTKSLAMPLGLHFMANLMQGGVLGFGVSGTDQSGLLQPVFNRAPEWLTGGQFGLEASVLGLCCVGITLILLYRWKPSSKTGA
jgi:membrane protease YdiL (CAAX protease family)